MFLDIGDYFVYYAAFSGNLISFSVGSAFAWTSPVIPKLKNEYDNPLAKPTSILEDSWIVSMISFGAIFGPLVAGYLSEFFGRKKTLLVFAAPMLASHIICALANKVYMFLIARFLLGIGMGGVFSTLPIYIAEISELKNRGILLCLMAPMICLGNLFMYAAGPFISIRLLSLLSIIPLVAFYILFGFLVPETPYHFLRLEKKDDAEKSLTKFRSKNSDVQKEIIIIMKTIEDSGSSTGRVRDLFKSRGIVKALVITISLMIFQQFSGINAVLGNMDAILKATNSTFPSEYSVIIIGCIQVVVTLITTQIVEKFGRKILLLQSLAGTCISLVGLAIYFYLHSIKYNIQTLYWLPIACLIIYIISFNSGLASIPWALTGELFPANIKSLASALTTCCCLTFSFLTTMCFPHVSVILGIDKTFAFFSFVCCLGFVFTLTYVPETKGKTLLEIQLMLSDRNRITKL